MVACEPRTHPTINITATRVRAWRKGNLDRADDKPSVIILSFSLVDFQVRPVRPQIS